MDAHLPWEDARKLGKNFLLPYLSVDGLKNDLALFLSLLYNRTYYHPYMWAPSDSMELATGWNLCYLDVEISGACVAMYREKYGSLVAWDAQAAHRSDIVPFPRAKLIFEAQACLLRFLAMLSIRSSEKPTFSQPLDQQNSWKWRVQRSEVATVVTDHIALITHFQLPLTYMSMTSRPGRRCRWTQQQITSGFYKRSLHIYGVTCN